MLKRPKHATIVAYLALFIAIGGTGYAAATIGSAQIKDNSIRGKDVRRGTLTGREIKESRLTGVAGLDTYSATTSAAITSPLETIKSAAASCRAGDRAVGGGIQINSNVDGSAVLHSSPLGSRTWSGTARIPAGSPGLDRSISVYAVCLRRPR